MEIAMAGKILGATGVVAALIVLSAALPATAGGESRVEVEEMLPALGAPQTSADHVPEGIDLDALGGVRPETVRSLGTDETADYWVGRAGSSRACLILHLPGQEPITAATCGLIMDVYRQGLALDAGSQRDDPTRSAQAYLLPSDVDPAKLGSMLTKVSSNRDGDKTNLLSRQQLNTTPLQPAALPRNNGEVFEFTPLADSKER
jgi:hypothetical protein